MKASDMNQLLDSWLEVYDFSRHHIIRGHITARSGERLIKRIADNLAEYKIDLSNPRAFKAIYGDQQFIDNILNDINIQSLNPYPNPFKASVNLPISLPASNHQYEVSCSIFDLMGERIFESTDKNIISGQFNIVWDKSSTVQKGIYIYSIKVKNKFLTREFHGRLVKE